jgi:hypothetical protein
MAFSLYIVLFSYILQKTASKEIVGVLRNICFAIIASFVFYFIVDVLKRAREYDAATPYISMQIGMIKGDVLAICREASHLSKRELPDQWKFNRDEVSTIFQNAPPRAPVNMIFYDGRRANLFEYMIDRARRTEKALQNLLIFSSVVGSEGVAKITDIQSDSYLVQMELIAPSVGKMTNTDLSFLTDAFDDHFQHIVALEKWAAANHLSVR